MKRKRLTKKEWKRKNHIKKSTIISPESSLVIRNVVGLFSLGVNLCLVTVAWLLYARYSTDVFPAVVGVCKETSTVYGICSTGQVVITGARSIEYAQMTAKLLVIKLSQAFHSSKIGVYNLFYPNIVCCCSLGYGIDMKRLRAAYQDICKYEPTLFSGMTLKISVGWKQYVRFICFKNGKINVTGIKNLNDLPLIREKLKMFLPFRIEPSELDEPTSTEQSIEFSIAETDDDEEEEEDSH